MTIATEIQRIKDNIANTYTALEEKGATLPENQNSDNLANTVASVTTGGGGGNNDPMIDLVNNQMAKFSPKNDTKDKTDFVNFTYYNLSSIGSNMYSNQGGIAGFVFSNDAPNIIYTNAKGFWIPNSATYEQTSESGMYKITFSENEKAIICANNNILTSTTDAGYSLIGVDTSITGNFGRSAFGILNFTKYCKLKVLHQSVIPFIMPTNLVSACKLLSKSPYLEDIQLENGLWSNQSIGADVSMADLLGIQSTYLDAPEIYNRIIDKETYKGYTYGVSERTLTSAWNLNSYWKDIIACRGKYPLVVNLTGLSTDTTYYINSPDITSNSYLLSQHTCNILFKINSSANYNFALKDSNDLTLTIGTEAFKFLVENAPNTSSKTIQLGAMTFDFYSKSYPELIATLQGKGWNVSA